MIISSAQWVDANRNTIAAIIDGELSFVPTDPQNRHYAAIIDQGIAIAEPEAS